MVAKLNQKEALAFLKYCGFSPLEPYVKSNAPWLVKCDKCKNNFELRLANYRSRYKNKKPTGCPKCLTKPVRTSENQALSEMRAAGFKPLEPFSKVIGKWKYECLTCQNTSVTSLHKVRQGNGCPYCSKNKVDPKLQNQRLKEARLVPLEPYRGNSSKWRLKHLDCGNEVVSTWAEIQSGQGGCGKCRYTKISQKLRMSDNDAEQIMRDAGGEPLEPYKNSHAKWKVRCLKCGQISSPLLSNVKKGQGVCMFCRPKSPVVTESNALKFIEAKGLIAISQYKSAQSKWKLQCLKCKKKDFYVYSWMKAQNYGCVYCSRHKVDPKDALRNFRSKGFEPLGEYVSAKKNIEVRCLNCNKTFLKNYDSLQSGRGCKYCQTAALDLLAPAYFYIIKSDDLNAIKVGIGNVTRKTDRISEHLKYGWTLLYRQDLDTGEFAFELEQKVLIWIRQERKLGIYLTKSQMPQGGWTETIDADELSVFEIRTYFEELLGQIYRLIED
jgi:hypothetical protein